MSILFHSTHFVPTPVSTLSGVVSAWRDAHGKIPHVLRINPPAKGTGSKPAASAAAPILLRATNGWFPYVVPELWVCGTEGRPSDIGAECPQQDEFEYVSSGWDPGMDPIHTEIDESVLKNW